MCFTSIMVFCPPYYTRFVPGIIKTPFRLIALFILFVLYFAFVIYKKRISKLFIITFILCLYFLIINIIYKRSLSYSLYSNFLLTIGAIAIIELFLNSELKLDFIKFNYFFWMFNIFLFFLILLFSYKLYATIFNRNNYILLFIFFLLLERNLILEYNNKFVNNNSYFICFILILMSFISKASTTLFCFIIYYIYIHIINKYFTKLRNKFLNNFNIYLLVVCLFFIIFVVFGTHSNLINIVSSLFKKSNEFSGRGKFYDAAVTMFLNKPIFGNGHNIEYEIWNAHNFILQYLVEGGIVGFSLIVTSYILIIKTINRKTNLDVICYLFLVLFIFTLRNQLEALGLNYLYFILSYIYFYYKTCDKDYIKLEFLE